jgi:hypothetical protein
MNVLVETPDPLFVAGDVVEWPHVFGSIFLAVVNVRATGRWYSFDVGNGLCVSADKTDATYTCAVQEGSTYHHEGGGDIRPGTVFVYGWDSLHEKARKVSWDKPVVGPDTNDNIDARQRGWASRTSSPATGGRGACREGGR